MGRVRTTIEIEDIYVQAIMNRYRVRTKTEAVDLALRHLAGQPMTREEALVMRGERHRKSRGRRSPGAGGADQSPRWPGAGTGRPG
jgi:Arc/MetJ family transcription regulator